MLTWTPQHLLAASLLSLLLAACGSSAGSQREGGVNDATQTTGRGQTVEEATPAHPWTGGEHEVVFHTLEESESAMGWGPLGKGFNPLKWPMWIDVNPSLDLDAQTASWGIEMLRRRGVFYGLGGPMLDPRLHMFECTGDAAGAVYLLGDVLVECRGKQGMKVYFRRVELDNAEKDMRSKYAPEVGGRWNDWWHQMLAHSQAVIEGKPGAQYLRVPIFIYSSRVDIGVRAERELRLVGEYGSFSNPVLFNYSGPYLTVPPEYCRGRLTAGDSCAALQRKK